MKGITDERILMIATLVVGNEILLGRTRDTNTQFLTEILLKRGLRLSRWVIVPDRKWDISSQLKGIVEEGFDLVVVSGGMGPTHDDITVGSVADALGLELSNHSETEDRMIKKWRERYPDLEMTPSSGKGIRKMATIPEGFRPIRNGSGMAEGLFGRTSDGRTSILIVPGVPVEYKAIIGGDEFPLLLPESDPDDQSFREIHFKGKESQISDVLEDLQGSYPSLDVGSYPQGSMMVIIRITGRKEKVDEALNTIRSKIEYLEREVI